MKVGLILEGGAMRGLFSAGVLDQMLDNNIKIDKIVGVSAGALFGVNYFSKQKKRALRYSLKYASDKRYISIRNLILTGNIVSKKFAYYKVQKELDKFDNETFINSNGEFEAVATNLETGLPEYLPIKDAFKDIEKLRASSSVPLVSRIVRIGNKKYLDGAISSSIPIDRLINEKYDKIIVVLTRPIDYKKEPLSKRSIRMVNFRYRKYPKFIKAMKNRYIMYNNTLEKIKDLENKGKIFVLRPSANLGVSVIERDKEKLKYVYNLGEKIAKDKMEDLKKYLEE